MAGSKKVDIEIVPKLSKTAGKALASGISAAASSGGAGGFGAMASGVGGALQQSGNPYAAAAGTGMQGASAIFDIMGKFVEKANPAIMEQIANAFEDMQGVIGQALVPAMQMLLPIFRGFADMVANLLPSMDMMSGLFAAFKPLLDGVQQVMKLVADILGPIIEFMVQFVTAALRPLLSIVGSVLQVCVAWYGALAPLVEIVMQLLGVLLQLDIVMPLIAEGIKFFADTLVDALHFLRKSIADFWNKMIDMIGEKMAKLLGLKKIDAGGRNKSSFGAAHRGASIVGVEALGASLQQAAFGGGGSAEERTAKATEDTADGLRELIRVAKENNIPTPGFTGN